MGHKQIFIAATRQNDGKTMVSLGLFAAIKKRFKNVSYMKPVGQQYRVVDGKKIDKDVILFQKVYQLKERLSAMSPIAVPKGFTEDYILKGDPKKLERKLDKAYKELTDKKEFLLIEGTGHGGVGSVFDFSNAKVAKRFNSKVILVCLGGIGRAIDEIMLNKAVFDLLGVEILGVIINKIQMDKYAKVEQLLRKGLARQGISVLGAIPFVDMLIQPTIQSIFENIKGELLSGEVGMLNHVEKCLIGDMVPHDALNMLSVNTLLIVPANREGLVMTALAGNMLETDVIYYVSGIIFTGAKKPHQKVLDLIKRTHIPTKLVAEDSFTVATKINNMLFKVRANETEKIKKAQELVEMYVDIDKICE